MLVEVCSERIKGSVDVGGGLCAERSVDVGGLCAERKRKC